jgi:hypothetical protein
MPTRIDAEATVPLRDADVGDGIRSFKRLSGIF